MAGRESPMTAPEEVRLTPAEVLRALNERIGAQAWPVEVRLDIHWVFLREKSFELGAFGDAPRRDRLLGKWIVDVEGEPILDAVARVLPVIASGTIRLAKFSNVFNFPRAKRVIVAYCLDRDGSVRAALEALGWHPRFKFNRETFAALAEAARKQDAADGTER
jgi:hypothetical protein